MKYYIQLSFLILISSTLFYSCKNDDNSGDSSVIIEPNRPNILLIIADDMGKDATAGFSEGSIKPTTPNIDQLKNTGLTFNNFWVYPTCSPTRASIITGKYGYSTGVKNAGDILSSSETVLQKYISEQTNNAYATAIVGKWHLSASNNTVNPEDFGVDYYKGLISGAAPDYYNWTITEDGATQNETKYITSKFTNLAIDWLGQQDKPWFLWLAYTAPHTPFHVPPTGSHSQGNLAPYSNGINPTPYYMAAIESMDFEIGRLLASLSQEEKDNTIIVFIGDNGSPGQVAQLPYTRRKAKGSLYQGGINTPMIVTGKNVSRTGIDENLVNSTDLFSSIASWAGASTSDINDSKNFSSLLTTEGTHRAYQYSEISDGTDEKWTIRNSRYKLLIQQSGDEMYDLGTDPYENSNLLNGTLNTEESQAKAELEAELANIRQ